MRLSTGPFAIVLGLALLSASPTRSEGPYSVSVANYEKIPASVTYVIDLAENSELTSTAGNILQDILNKRGFTLDASGKLDFKISTARSVDTSTPDAIFDSSNTTLNLPFAGEKSTLPIGHIFRIDITVYDHVSGRMLARGNVNDNRPEDDHISVQPAMIETLLNRMEF